VDNAGPTPAAIPSKLQMQTKTKYHMEKTIDYELKRGDLAALIRGMDVGDILRFPISKHNSLRSTTGNGGMAVERSEGRRWSVIADLKNRESIVTRIS